jgi:hypothetical protein
MQAEILLTMPQLLDELALLLNGPDVANLHLPKAGLFEKVSYSKLVVKRQRRVGCIYPLTERRVD